MSKLEIFLVILCTVALILCVAFRIVIHAQKVQISLLRDSGKSLMHFIKQNNIEMPQGCVIDENNNILYYYSNEELNKIKEEKQNENVRESK